MRHDIVGRVQLLAVEGVGQHRRRTVELVPHDAPCQVLARELASLEVERVAVAVVGRAAEHRDPAVVLDPAQLAVVGNVAPDEVAALRVPGRSFHPHGAGPQPLNRRVGLPEGVEAWIDGEDVGVGEVGGWRAAATEVAGRRGNCRRWRNRSRLRGRLRKGLARSQRRRGCSRRADQRAARHVCPPLASLQRAHERHSRWLLNYFAKTLSISRAAEKGSQALLIVARLRRKDCESMPGMAAA